MSLTELTPEQEALMDVVRDEWIAYGLSTAPADRAAAEAGVDLAYRAAGLEPPALKVWVGSPWAILDKAQEIDDEPKTREQYLRGMCFGQHDASWLSFYDYFRRIGFKEPVPLDGLLAIGRSCGWWLPFDRAVILSERYCVLHLDEQGDPHCETGPAIVWPDGRQLFYWHGVWLGNGDEDLIVAPERITVERIREHANAEIRRVMIDRYGHERYIRDAGAEKVAVDDWGTLWRAPVEGDEPLMMVEVLNATPEADGSFAKYWLRVPPTVRTPLEGVAWTHNVPPEVYRSLRVAT